MYRSSPCKTLETSHGESAVTGVLYPGTRGETECERTVLRGLSCLYESARVLSSGVPSTT